MGVQVELPAWTKRSVMSFLETPTKDTKEMDHDSWQWGAFENLQIGGDEMLAHPTRFNMNCGQAATLADSPGGSSKHLISPSTTGSSPLSPSSPHSPPFSPFGGTATHQRLKKKSHEADMSPMSPDYNGEFRPSRWDSGRWRGGDVSFGECSASTPPRGQKVCKCAAVVTADVAVICCCPFSLLHLLAIAFIKIPAAMVVKTVTKLKTKVAARRKRAVAVHEEEDESVQATSCPPSRCRSYDAGELQTWAPALSFGDQKLWKDYFDSPDRSVGSSEELLRGKS